MTVLLAILAVALESVSWPRGVLPPRWRVTGRRSAVAGTGG